ncbi:hypothetical protein SAMN02745157_1862 [Kaistia soli DSM 19436]|uniref:Uncharacterized protein n=1 Tax=Kaistia soli DSM 19436 TaxID=1122133 RepID=A0A1M4ZNM1_9HYPH|nr:hypothetical protein [Kaistia soli]SHF19176.1 hypothetical protein SAMN02745157_1862 [Kaistia soli DSM 19436]
MLLITSAFPLLKRLDEDGVDVGQDLVKRCVGSWQANGFDVLSVHNEAERDLIGAGLPGVTYRFVDEVLPPGARKMPSLAAVLADLPPTEPIGIINADIFMPQCTDLASRMGRLARQSSVILHRWEVPSLTRREGRQYEIGVDLFAFTPALIAPALTGLNSRPYQLGVPWWDYVLPVAASLYAPLSLVSDPILLHHSHEQAWNDGEWHEFAAISEAYLLEQARLPLADKHLAEQLAERLGNIDEFYSVDPDPGQRHYALADLTLHLIHTMSSQHAVSLIAEMSFPGVSDDPWSQRSEGEAVRKAVIDERRGAATGESQATAKAEPGAPVIRRELGKPLSLAINEKVTQETPTLGVLAAGFGDLWRVAAAIGKVLEKRWRRWRRRDGRQPAP